MNNTPENETKTDGCGSLPLATGSAEWISVKDELPKEGDRVRMPASARYASFPAFCERIGLPVPVAEFRFHGERKWRFDFAWPEHRVYLEINGGVFSGGRHSRGAGMLKDWEKKNTASGMGWRPIECQPKDLTSTATVVAIRAALNYGLPSAGGQPK